MFKLCLFPLSRIVLKKSGDLVEFSIAEGAVSGWLKYPGGKEKGKYMWMAA